MSRFAILLGGRLEITPRLRRELERGEGLRVIAADGGMVHARALGLPVELWVGDFDSSPPELLAQYPEVPREVYPREKDKTDGELAIVAARSRGAGELLLLGALGGQSDHSLAHLTLALTLARQGLRIVLSSGLEEAHPLLPGRHRFDFPPSTPFSLIPLTDLHGLGIRGARWELAQTQVALGESLTLSNQVTSPEGLEVELAQGYGILIAQFK
ncbi:thiamine diphosphokinase [Calidithermus roseus]|uniref:Thiamine diphosphokinase n=1 Tax=Calidithermus roseus TaxID=1644118 RepID=A0A399ETU5_9DEIN|nr:thiamine diphosphokinase [Calidithermus roseus]RIH86960.1 Thiamine pyrophosphokinase [Calidithermus roseus]